MCTYSFVHFILFTFPLLDSRRAELKYTESAAMTISLQSMKLSNSLFKSTEPLILPVIPEQYAQDTEFDVSTLIKQHQNFYSTDRRLDHDQAREKATSDVKAIRYAFPESRRSWAQSLMCSWFALLCAVDDEMESLKPDEALHTLTQLVLTIKKIHHGEISKKRDPRRFRAGPYARQEQQNRLINLNQHLILSAQTTLPPTPYHKFLSQITQVWDSMKNEILLRHSPLKTEHTYLQIRSHTVGLRPFFSILQTEFLTEKISNPSITAHLDRLQNHISIVVGLQNDLVGLKRDIASVEAYNIVLLKTEASPGAGIARAVREVVRMHNQQVLHAVEEFRGIVEKRGGWDGCALVAYGMLAFATRHFLWACKAERYRV